MPADNRAFPEFASTLETSSSLETEDLGERLGRACRGGEIIALVGPLGAGKTCLVRGLARGLGVSDQCAASPTFTLTISGAGITNNSGMTQNFAITHDGAMFFTNSATAGSLTRYKKRLHAGCRFWQSAKGSRYSMSRLAAR